MAQGRFIGCFIFLIAVYSPCSSLPEYCGKNPSESVKAYVPTEIEGYRLNQAQVVIRHGDRTKASYPSNRGYCWPNDKAVWDCTLTSFSHPAIKHDQHYLAVDRVYRKVYMEDLEPMKGDCPLGALTFKGYGQQETNGKILNQAYVKTGFLKQNFSYTDMYVRSDDMPRTIQSAQSLIRGMYPPETEQSDRTQVIDILTMDKSLDNMEPNSVLCPKLAEYQRDFLKSPQFMNHFSNVTKPILLELQKAVHSNKTLDLADMDSLTDCIHTHQCHNFDVPVTDGLFERMVADIVDRDLMQFNYPSRERFAKAGIGFLVRDLWQAMQRSMEGTGPKFLLYSGHDYTISPMLAALNISDGHWPPYASMLRFELWQSTSSPAHLMSASYAVRVIYNGKELNLPYCDSSPCDVKQFEKYISTVIPQDSHTECKVTDPTILEEPLGRMRRGMQRFVSKAVDWLV